MSSLPLVSILIPIHDSEFFIEDTIRSCFHQTYKNIEIIVVDDHSSDGSYKIVKDLEKRNPKMIRIIKNKGKGACAARNYAYELSTGQYIQYLDADDILNPVKIESQLTSLNNDEVKSIANCQWGRFYDKPENVNWEHQVINNDYNEPWKWLVDSWQGLGMSQTSVWLTPRILIEEVGGWNESLMINQDGEFFSRVLLKASAIRYSEEAKVYYRSGNPSSISQKNSTSSIKAKSLLKSYELYEENMLSIYDSPKIREALGMNYLNFIYRFYSLRPDLVKIARAKYYSLGFNKMKVVGGGNFKRLAKIIGFENALSIKKLLNLI